MRYDHFTMLPEHAFQPRNGRSGMTLEGGKGSAPPDFGPLADAMRDTGARMEALGNRQLAFGQQRYQETLPLFQQVTAAQLEGQGLAMELARDAVKEKLKYTALEDSLLDEVKKFNERQQSDYFAGQASADVQQALTSQRGSAFRNLSRFGVNPNDRRFADINRGFALSGAAMNAGAPSGHKGTMGDNWACSAWLWTNYNTVAPPNWTYPTSTTAASSAWIIGVNGIFPARSYHAGGVVATMCDGSTRFITDGVNLLAYQRLGSRNDGQVINE